MKKYFITDLTTNESKELSKVDFYESVIFNITASIDYQEISTEDGLKLIRNMTLDDEKTNKGFSEYINGFLYEIEVA